MFVFHPVSSIVLLERPFPGKLLHLEESFSNKLIATQTVKWSLVPKDRNWRKVRAPEGKVVANNDCPDIPGIRKVPQKIYRPELVEG